MVNNMSSTHKYLQDKYGPLMSLAALAKTLDRAPQGLRVSLNSNSEISKSINAAKKKMGRRVYFKTEKIAQIIDDEV